MEYQPYNPPFPPISSYTYLIGRKFAAALLPRLFGKNPRSYQRAPPVGFELETNGFQFYAIANLDKPCHMYQPSTFYTEIRLTVTAQQPLTTYLTGLTGTFGLRYDYASLAPLSFPALGTAGPGVRSRVAHCHCGCASLLVGGVGRTIATT